MKRFLLSSLLGLSLPIMAQQALPPTSGSTRLAINTLFANHRPTLQYDDTLPADSLAAWRSKMSEAMAELMHHPAAAWGGEELVGTAQRDGYTIERWRSWPLESSPVHYYLLIPDTTKFPGPRPAALCIPGFGQTKELLAGERSGNFELEGSPADELSKNAMGVHYVKEGIIAAVVDNPCFGELSDNGYADFLDTSRLLLESGWSYLGLASWQDRVVLDALKRHQGVDSSRIIVSGFSLGTEPLMVLGLLDPTIYAFVYNDFLCRTRERIIVMDLPQENGSRPLPNTIEHLIPGLLMQFDFPDIVAALAPRQVICTEGGMDRDFAMIGRAYAKAGAPEAFTYYHYPKFADVESRALGATDDMPAGVDRATFFRLANVDPPSHYFKHHLVIPWVKEILK